MKFLILSHKLENVPTYLVNNKFSIQKCQEFPIFVIENRDGTFPHLHNPQST